jgi:hypothetical protein
MARAVSGSVGVLLVERWGLVVFLLPVLAELPDERGGGIVSDPVPSRLFHSPAQAADDDITTATNKEPRNLIGTTPLFEAF